MSAAGDRRGFLRGLVTLPLIGGGVTLIGNPTRAAEPFTERLLAEYVNWLGFERHRAHVELHRDADVSWFHHYGPAYEWHCARSKPGLAVPASTRAAIVLAAVGCDWREGSR